MKRATKRVLVFALLVVPALIGLGAYWFIPRAEVPRDEGLPEGDWQAFAYGEVRDGGPEHPAAGNVTLYRDNETQEWVLYFQGYDASRGRDARFFLTLDPDPEDRAQIDEGVELSVPGIGPADARGDFVVPVPDDVDPSEFGAVVAWDLRFDERHALATLDPLEV